MEEWIVKSADGRFSRPGTGGVRGRTTSRSLDEEAFSWSGGMISGEDDRRESLWNGNDGYAV